MATGFTMYSGDTKDVVVDMVDENGASVDVTGAMATYVIYSSKTPVVLVTKSVGDGIIVLGSTITILLDPADTADLSGYYYHELEVTNYVGVVATVLQDSIKILKDMVQ